jgi:hypothetical protein
LVFSRSAAAVKYLGLFFVAALTVAPSRPHPTDGDGGPASSHGGPGGALAGTCVSCSRPAIDLPHPRLFVGDWDLSDF